MKRFYTSGSNISFISPLLLSQFSLILHFPTFLPQTAYLSLLLLGFSDNPQFRQKIFSLPYIFIDWLSYNVLLTVLAAFREVVKFCSFLFSNYMNVLEITALRYANISPLWTHSSEWEPPHWRYQLHKDSYYDRMFSTIS